MLRVINLLLILVLIIRASSMVIPNTSNKNVERTIYQTFPIENGSKFIYETIDGQYREESVIIKNKGTSSEELIIEGIYSFKAEDGNIYRTKYRADKNGYHIIEYSSYPALIAPPVSPTITVPPAAPVPINVLISAVG